MGSALPDLQADLLRARMVEDWPRFIDLSELCDRFGQATFIDPMEGYIRRMLWAAAAEGRCRQRPATIRGGPHCQPERAAVERWCAMRERLARDFERFARASAPTSRTRPGTLPDRSPRPLSRLSLPHPIGKGSGQLSLNLDQLETDRAAGLAFVVLKTVIAEDPSGERTMGAWAIHETG